MFVRRRNSHTNSNSIRFSFFFFLFSRHSYRFVFLSLSGPLLVEYVCVLCIQNCNIFLSFSLSPLFTSPFDLHRINDAAGVETSMTPQTNDQRWRLVDEDDAEIGVCSCCVEQWKSKISLFRVSQANSWFRKLIDLMLCKRHEYFFSIFFLLSLSFSLAQPLTHNLNWISFRFFCRRIWLLVYRRLIVVVSDKVIRVFLFVFWSVARLLDYFVAIQ